MQNYKIEIKEISAKIVSVKAPSEIEALEKVKELYRRGDIVLEYDSFVDAEFLMAEKEDCSVCS